MIDSSNIETYKKHEIKRHRREEEFVIQTMRQNGGKAEGLFAREYIDVIRRLWASNRVTSTSSGVWLLVK